MGAAFCRISTYYLVCIFYLAMWEYSFRDIDGSVRKGVIEAGTRTDAIAILKSKKIAVVNLQEIERKNYQHKSTTAEKVKNFSLLRVSLIIAIAFAVFVVAVVMINQKPVVENQKVDEVNKVEKPDEPKKKGKETNIAPATNKVDKLAKLREQIYVDEKGVRRWPGGLRVVDKPPTYVISNANDIVVKGRNINRQIFKHASENQIAGLLKVEIGETVLGTMRYGKRFVDDFKKSLKDEIIITEKDSEEDRILKEAVIETKKELLQRMNAGEDIGQIMSNTRQELQDIAKYRQQIRQDLYAAIKDENMTEKDIDDFVAAANQLLKEKNAKPLSFPSLLRRKIQLRDVQKKGIKNEN